MGFKQLNSTGWAMTYLIWDESTNEATLVDPVYDFMDQYIRVLDEMNLTLRFAMATHTHADHITACFSLLWDQIANDSRAPRFSRLR